MRVEYRLTESGKSLLTVLGQLMDWGNRYMEEHAPLRSHCDACLFYEEK